MMLPISNDPCSRLHGTPYTRSSCCLWCSEPPRYWHNTLRANSPSAHLSSLLIPLSSSQGLSHASSPTLTGWSCCPSSSPHLSRSLQLAREKISHPPSGGPLLDRIHALWVAFIGPSSGVCSCRMHKTCTKGRLVGSRLSACGDTENRPDQHSEETSQLHWREQSRGESEPWRAHSEGVSRSGVRIHGGLLVIAAILRPVQIP